jgi:SNF2 family DNA or RNA helicase
MTVAPPPLPPILPRPSWVRGRLTPRRVEPATVYGILNADESEIVLSVNGHSWACDQAITAISGCTAKTTIITDTVAAAPLNWATYIQLGCTFGSKFVPDDRLTGWFHGELARRTQWADQPLRYRLPRGLELKPWQPPAVRNIAHVGCLLEDAPRLGKTISTIVGLAERERWPEYGPVTPIIVVCPAGVVTDWVRAIELWAPHWRVCAWRGENKEVRRGWVGKFDVYVASYATARLDAKHNATRLDDVPLVKIKARTLVADEYHWLSNPDAKQTRATQRLARQAGLVIPLSGTPFTHNISNMKPTLEVFERGAYPDKGRIVNRWLIEKATDYGTVIQTLNPLREAEMRTCFLGRQMRRAREDVAQYLSSKTYSTRVIPIPAPYAKMYRDMELKMIAELDDGAEVTTMSTITKMQRLQQLAASACDLELSYTEDKETGLPVEHQHLRPKLPSWKIEAMIEVLAELEWPALAFGISKPLMLLAGQEAERHGARVGYIVGGQTPRVRDGYKDAFQSGKLDLLCVVAQAGGTGLTLNMAGTEIFLQRPVSFVDSLQAEDRAVGDRYPTLDIVDIVAEWKPGESIDYRIRQIVHGKAGNISDYFGDARIVRELFGGNIKGRAA